MTLRGHELANLGSGKRPGGLFIHEILGPQRQRARLINRLDDSDRVIVPDLFGHRESTNPSTTTPSPVMLVPCGTCSTTLGWARFVVEILADPPKGGRGLSVPAMPVGTPGMEQGDVLLITEQEPTVFAKVTKPAQQSS